MKTLIIFLVLSFSYTALSSDIPNWVKEQSRTQAGGWIWFPGRGEARTEYDADVIARGRALDYLKQECQDIHKSVKFHERYVTKRKGKFHVFVRASVKQDDCKFMKNSKPEKRKKFINESLKSAYLQFKLRMANRTMDYSKCKRSNLYCAYLVADEYEMHNDYRALLYARYSCYKGYSLGCSHASSITKFLLEN